MRIETRIIFSDKVLNLERPCEKIETSKQSNNKEVGEVSKVEDIKRRVQNGTYKVNLELTAKQMAQELLLN